MAEGEVGEESASRLNGRKIGRGWIRKVSVSRDGWIISKCKKCRDGCRG